MCKVVQLSDNYARLQVKYKELVAEIDRLKKEGKILISEIQKAIDAKNMEKVFKIIDKKPE